MLKNLYKLPRLVHSASAKRNFVYWLLLFGGSPLSTNLQKLFFSDAEIGRYEICIMQAAWNPPSDSIATLELVF